MLYSDVGTAPPTSRLSDFAYPVGDDAHIVPAFLFEEGGPPKVVEGVILFGRARRPSPTVIQTSVRAVNIFNIENMYKICYNIYKIKGA